MSYETENWPVVKAKWYTSYEAVNRRSVRVVVIHAMQFKEVPNAAEIIAHDFATRPDSSKASAHLCIDNNSTIQCVMDNDIAYAAPGCNNDGIQIELAGFIEQSEAQWDDPYSLAVIARAADATAQYCLKYGLPVRHLTDDELRSGKKGIVGHDQVSRVYKKSDHTDPGKNFPWAYFIAETQKRYDARK